MKKIIKEFIVNDSSIEYGGMCQIISFNLPKKSGFSHGQFVAEIDFDDDSKNTVIDLLKDKKVRVTLEVIE